MPSHSRHHEHYQHQRHHRHPVRARAHISTPVHDQRCTTCTCRAHLNFETQTKQNICASAKLTVPSGSPSTFSCACKQSDINSNEQLKQVIDMPCEIHPEKKNCVIQEKSTNCSSQTHQVTCHYIHGVITDILCVQGHTRITRMTMQIYTRFGFKGKRRSKLKTK